MLNKQSQKRLKQSQRRKTPQQKTTPTKKNNPNKKTTPTRINCHNEEKNITKKRPNGKRIYKSLKTNNYYKNMKKDISASKMATCLLGIGLMLSGY